MNLFVGITCVIVGTIIGKLLSEKFKKRKIFYNDFYSFNQRMINEVSFKQTPLQKIISLEDSTFYYYLEELIFNKNDEIYVSFLNSDENTFLKEYAQNIGVSDTYSQLVYLKSIDTQILNKMNCCIEDDKKYRKLYVKLGFLFGLIALVVIL